MLRTAFFLCLFGTLLTVGPVAQATAAHTPRGLQNQRLTRGNHVPVYKTYRYHSRQEHPLFSFLHFGSHRPAIAAKHHAHPARSTHRHTTGLF